jgi:hypothetical protein
MRPSLHADQQWGVPTNILLLECLDVAGVAEEMGCADVDAALEDQLHAVRWSSSLLINPEHVQKHAVRCARPHVENN